MTIKKYIKNLFYVTSFIIVFSTHYTLANTCDEVLSNKNMSIILLYDDMLERGGISLKDLKLAKQALEDGLILPNPFIEKLNGNDGARQHLRNNIFSRLSNEAKTSHHFRNWINKKIVDLEEDMVEREEMAVRTTNVYSEAVFHQGSFAEPFSFKT